VDQPGGPHLAEHVQVVVARRAVGAETDVDARRQQFGQARDAGTQLEIRLGAVDDGRTALGKQRNLVVAEMANPAPPSYGEVGSGFRIWLLWSLVKEQSQDVGNR
jgi:hypothetical protein